MNDATSPDVIPQPAGGGGAGGQSQVAQLAGELLSEERLSKLLRLIGSLEVKDDPRDRITFGEAVDVYLRNVREEISPTSFYNTSRLLRRFVKTFGPMRVAEATPVQLREWVRHRETWKSSETRRSFNIILQACLNWGVRNKVIKENPFTGVSYPAGDPRPETTDAQYRALLRASDPLTRRMIVFLRFTGCRPSEMASLQWHFIVWARNVFVLKIHKTARKTGKARIVIMHPVVVKLLRWIERNRQLDTVEERAMEVIRELLAAGPMRASLFRAECRRRGLPVKHLGKIARAAGALHWKVGGIGSAGGMVWGMREHFPRDYGVTTRKDRGGYWAQVDVGGLSFRHKVGESIEEARANVAALVEKKLEPGPVSFGRVRPRANRASEFVFLNCYGTPWTKDSAGRHIARAKRRARISDRCVLYGLRHKFGSDLIRKNVNHFTVAKLLGHADTRMLKRYVHIDNDVDTLLEGVVALTGNKSGASE